MKFLLKATRIFDKNGPYDQQRVDILLDAGKVVDIAPSLEVDTTQEDLTVIASNDLCLSIGWTELHSNFCDPGYEDRETLESGLAAAKAGGFTSVALTPETLPAGDTKTILQYWKQHSAGHSVEILPLGAVTKNREGKELAELYDLFEAGAVGFYDGKHAIKNPNLLKLALQYTKRTGAPLFVHPFEASLAQNGVMHEGETSTYLGLKAMPSMSEAMMVNRDLYLLEYTGGKLHFAGISTEESVVLIQEAKAKGLQVSADVNFYNLIATDQVLESYDSNWKLNPPLRESKDIAALWKGLQEGTIDAIAVDHTPWNIERKVCEFQLAAFGLAGLETAYSALNTFKPEWVSDQLIIEALTTGPKKVLNQDLKHITIGAKLALTLFDPTQKWQLEKQNAKSSAFNLAYAHQKMIGKVFMTLPEVN